MIWLSSLLLPVPGRYGIWALALLVELITPMLAVSSAYREASYRPRVFHPEHIPERYGLFTLIVLGESVLAVAAGTAETGWCRAAVLLVPFGTLLSPLAFTTLAALTLLTLTVFETISSDVPAT